MTVPSEVARTDAISNGVNLVFPYSFRILDESELLVITRDSDDVETTLVLNTDYTVSGVGELSGGNVTLIAATANTNVVSITRNMAFTQDTDLQANGQFSAETHEDCFDRAMMIAQQLKDESDRCFRISASIDPNDMDLEMPAAEAGQVLIWNDDATGLENVSPGSVALAVPADLSVTNAKMATMAQSTIKGRAASAGTGAPVDLTATQVRTILSLVPDASTVESSGTTLQVKDAGITAAKLAATIVSGLTGETAIATGDYIFIGDVSAAAPRKMLITDVLTVINSLTADASPDTAADYILTYDASASAVKKVLMSVAVPAATAATTSASGIIELATGTEVQTGTDAVRAVCPSTAVYHQSACKGWCHFEQIGTHSILDSYNVSSISDSGVGDTTVNWSTNFANANYACIATADAGAARVEKASKATGSCVVIVESGDDTGVSVAGFGDR
jgi:hypothetical protein